MVDEGHAPVVAVLVPAVKISLMDDIGPRRPCRASAKSRQSRERRPLSVNDFQVAFLSGPEENET